MSGTDELIRGLAERIVERRLQHSGFLAVNIGDAERVESVLRECGLAEVIEALETIQEGRGAFSRDQLTFAKNVIEESKECACAALATLRSKVVPQ